MYRHLLPGVSPLTRGTRARLVTRRAYECEGLDLPCTEGETEEVASTELVLVWSEPEADVEGNLTVVVRTADGRKRVPLADVRI